jgi:RimJ/RimL family protein N-acetyltransferase
MSAPPKTVLEATPQEAEAIRQAVRNPDIASLGPGRRVASLADAGAVAEFFSDPAVSDPIYDLPRPFTVDNVRDWIEAISVQQALGEALLVLTYTPDGQLISYSKFSVWPDRSSGELGGAMRASRQNSGQGRGGMANSLNWMFESLGVRLIGLTAALDNVRSAAIIEGAGFVSMGERDGIRPDGTVRRSRYWEMDRDAWRARWSADQAR